MDIQSKFWTRRMGTGRTLLKVSSRTVGSCGLVQGLASREGSRMAKGGERRLERADGTETDRGREKPHGVNHATDRTANRHR